MKKVELTGAVRTTTGTKNADQLRREKQVPCVLYGGGSVTHFATDAAALGKVVHTPDAYRVELDLGGRKVMAKLQETQFHPVSDAILHADFIELAEDKPARVTLSLRLKGQPAGVRKGGKLNQTLRKLEVVGLPSQLPEHLEYDVEHVEIGQNVRVRDLKFAGIEVLNKPEEVVLKVSVPKRGADAPPPAAAAPAAAAHAAGAKKAEAKPAAKK